MKPRVIGVSSMANKKDWKRNQFMLTGALAKKGYDWWWHSFTGYHAETGEARAFFIEFFTCNPALGAGEPKFGQLSEEAIPSYMLVKCGSWGEDGAQLHRFFGWDSVSIPTGKPFSVTAGDCYLDETEMRGSVCISPEDAKEHPEWMCDCGSMKWNLTISKKVAFHVGYGAGRLFRRMNAFEMYWHAQGMKTAFSGTVEWKGETYLVRPQDCYGYADKNWGSDFTSPWVWLSSNNLVSKRTGQQLNDSVFDIGGGCPRVFGIPLRRKLLSSFWYEGKNYEFNFSKFWTLTFTKFNCRETEEEILWDVYQRNLFGAMKVEISCRKKDMLFVNYEAPNGTKRHNRLFNGGTGTGTVLLYRRVIGRLRLIDEIHAQNVGCEYGEY